ncbi:MAG: hypothetical protein EZS28_026361 [Streblomastix strix]|uniref:Uncharacterized protein n=1 Tax=Streblomastix strix TaxID=222440 RepID=A0A5J4V6P2_9EUKA|nr:MAG: hypothetical protein EZS28_026361 [Streblomastix strix]
MNKNLIRSLSQNSRRSLKSVNSEREAQMSRSNSRRSNRSFRSRKDKDIDDGYYQKGVLLETVYQGDEVRHKQKQERIDEIDRQDELK